MNDSVQDVKLKLAELYRHYVYLRLLLLASAGLAVFFSFIILFMVTDWVIGYSALICWLSWGVVWAMAVGFGFFSLHVLRRRFNDSAMAVMVERVLPGTHNHLINAVQLSDSGDSLFANHVLREYPLEIDRIPVGRLFSRQEIRWCITALSTSLGLLLLLFLIAPQASVQAVSRLFSPGSALPPHSLTRIVELKPGEVEVVRGSSLEIEVATGGLLPRTAELFWDRGGRRPLVIPMEQVQEEPGMNEDERRFTVELTNLVAPSRYRVVASDARSGWQQIRIREIPGLLDWRAVVIPPAYTGLDLFSLEQESDSMKIPQGSKIRMESSFSSPVSKLEVFQGEQVVFRYDDHPSDRVKADFTLLGEQSSNGVRLALESVDGGSSRELLPWLIIEDRVPRVEFIKPTVNLEVNRDEMLPIIFRARDDYGVDRVTLNRMIEGNQEQIVGTAPNETLSNEFDGRFMLEVASLDVKPGEVVNLRMQVFDNSPFFPDRYGSSSILSLTVRMPEDSEEADGQAQKAVRNALHELVDMQRVNLRATTVLRDSALQGRRPGRSAYSEISTRQSEIKQTARRLADSEQVFGHPRVLLIGLLENELAMVVRVLEPLVRSQVGEDLDGLVRELASAIRLQRRIIAVLSGLPEALEHEQQHRQRTDLLDKLRKLTEGQKLNLKATRDLLEPDSDENASRLARVQDRLAQDLDSLMTLGRNLLQRQQEDDFGLVVRQVLSLFYRQNLYEIMVTAAESLDYLEIDDAIVQESESFAILMRGMDIFNQWRAENAQQRLAEAAEVIGEIGEALREMENKQSEIAEVTRELARRDSFDDEVRRELGMMDREQEKMQDLLEQLAQDLYAFPELPVANELNSKMLEIFEDVQQAANSENEPAIEIAVQKEDALLDAIRETVERVEDVEMWLPDTPDNIVWNMETFDTDEFPDIPLVPLPDELEDIVGELLDQAAEIDFEAQDTTGNNLFADLEMGWDIMDGPMPNFSAKGKSGNMRPNENEMTGRSGAGREGQAVGELVEDVVKGLEGRQTEARRTQDSFQQGMVEEEDDSTLVARSTGGGKLGGESETIGMFGHAPRRDLHMDPGRDARNRLRQETEALYATARMLYLPTGGLGLAAADLHRSISEIPDLPSLNAMHRRVTRRLDQARVEIRDGAVLSMPFRQSLATAGAVVDDFNLDQVDQEYRLIIMDYYKSLAGD